MMDRHQKQYVDHLPDKAPDTKTQLKNRKILDRKDTTPIKTGLNYPLFPFGFFPRPLACLKITYL